MRIYYGSLIKSYRKNFKFKRGLAKKLHFIQNYYHTVKPFLMHVFLKRILLIDIFKMTQMENTGNQDI